MKAVASKRRRFGYRRIKRCCEIIRMVPRLKPFLDAAGVVNHANGCVLDRNIKPCVISHGHLL